jgi:hypothetical protein
VGKCLCAGAAADCEVKSLQFIIHNGINHAMDRNKIKELLELALRPAEKPPTLEEAL